MGHIHNSRCTAQHCIIGFKESDLLVKVYSSFLSRSLNIISFFNLVDLTLSSTSVGSRESLLDLLPGEPGTGNKDKP